MIRNRGAPYSLEVKTSAVTVQLVFDSSAGTTSHHKGPVVPLFWSARVIVECWPLTHVPIENDEDKRWSD